MMVKLAQISEALPQVKGQKLEVAGRGGGWGGVRVTCSEEPSRYNCCKEELPEPSHLPLTLWEILLELDSELLGVFKTTSPELPLNQA